MIAVIDYRAGNLTSVLLAFQALNAEARITSDPDMIRSADRVVFPGVGAAGASMANLADLGLADVIPQVVASGKPFLGICVGTQILLDSSEEDGGTACLGLLPGTVKLFRPTSRSDKVPHMGWNNVSVVRPHPLLEGIEDNSEFYFVHSYYPAPSDPATVVAETEYAGVRFASVLGRGNLAATQFHPEKSGRPGLKLLENFSQWNGRHSGNGA
ncbi:MAG: imidazole glycerol phosphate synthase subunit HisH [Lentisphaerae bacterium]|nr:imidazole glycerol phosphate synthase subunit HisH [Lentisphaerota bacterium]